MVVVGGGNVAIDAARVAKRSGASEVTMLSLETEDIMPASLEERAEAREDGVVINPGWGPKEVLGEDRVSGIVFKKCTSVFNAEHKFAPEYDESQRAYSEAPEAGAEPISQQYTSGGVENRLAEHSPYRWPAAISIGRKPTFNEQSGHDERVLEAYALTDDWLELYGHRVRCEFVGFLRPQIKFDSADDLVAELKRNADETRELTSRAS